MSRVAAKNFLRKVNNPYPTESQSYTAWEKGFIEGFDSSQANPCFEEQDMLDYHEWLDTSQVAADFWKKNRVQPTMDGSHLPKVFASRRELLNLWKQSKSNHNDLETNIIK